MSLQVSLDKSVYAPGAPMQLTVVTGAGERGGGTVPITVHVQVGDLAGDATGSIQQPTTPVEVTDPDRIWAATSDDGTTAIFTSVA